MQDCRLIQAREISIMRVKKTNAARIITIAIFITLNALLSSSGFSDPRFDWYQYHGPNRDRISTEKEWRTNWNEKEPAIAWSKSIGIGFSSISTANGRVFTMGNENDKDTVWCFDAKTGQEIWRYTYACELFPTQHEGGPGCTPTVDTESVYTISKDGQLYCLDVKTGKEKWKKDIQKEYNTTLPTWRFADSPLLDGDRIIIDVGPTVALNKKTGETIWITKNYEPAYSSPIAFTLNGVQHIAVLPKSGLAILDGKTGKEVGTFPWPTNYGVNATTPIVFENKVFLSTGYNQGGSLVEIQPTGEIKEIWHNRLMRNHINTCVLWNGYIYGFDESTLKCINAKTGEDVWKERDLGKGSLMLADGKLIVLSETGELIVANASEKGFTPIGRKKVLSGKCWTIPVLSNAMIYCRNAAGDLICLDVQK